MWLTKLSGSAGSLAGRHNQPGMPNELRNAIKTSNKRDSTKGTAWAPLPVTPYLGTEIQEHQPLVKHWGPGPKGHH